MRGWGYAPRRESKSGTSATFLCPWHDDHHPSLVVDKQLRDGATDLGFKCMACGETGYGAIQLAARLMGIKAGPVPKEDLPMVLNELATRCEVKLEEEGDGQRVYDTLRVRVVGWDMFHAEEKQYADWNGDSPIFERGIWTEEGLKALGVKVELATRRAKKSDISGDNDTYAEIKIGDLITEPDKDTGEPLYRCSFGRDFYRGQKAETKTIEAWGKDVESTFGIEPIARFIKRETPKQ